MSSKKREPCAVCFNRIEYQAVGECNHRVCCATCALRLRQLHGDVRCVVCKFKLEKVIITTALESRPFSELIKKQAELVVDSFEPTTLYAEDAMAFKAEMDHLRTIACCGQQFPNRKAFDKHASNPAQHRIRLCALCLDHRGLFFQEHPKLTPQQLVEHIKQEHPTCKFCPGKPFYNTDALYKHLNDAHEQCHVCTKLRGQGGGNAEYFKDYSALERHFKLAHFLCEEPECRREHFLHVFATEMEWINHGRIAHGRQSKGPIKFAFDHKDREFHPATRDLEFTSVSAPQPTSALPQPPAVALASEFPPLGSGPARRVIVSTGAAFRNSTSSSSSSRTTASQDFPPLRGATLLTAPTPAQYQRAPSLTAAAPVRTQEDFPALSRPSTASPPPFIATTAEDFPALPPPSSRRGNTNRLSRDEVRQLAFGEKKKATPAASASASTTTTSGMVLVGKKKQADAVDLGTASSSSSANREQKRKERKAVQDMGFKFTH